MDTIASSIGIGTNAPAYKLDVYGDINTTGTYRVNGTDVGQILSTPAGNSGEVWTSSGSGRGSWTPIGNGAVTSVGLALPSEFTISNSPVTHTGTLTGAWANQAQGYVLAAPLGGLGTPAFRALADSDIPDTISLTNINQIATRPLSSLTGLDQDNLTIYALLAGRTGGQTSSAAVARMTRWFCKQTEQ